MRNAYYYFYYLVVVFLKKTHKRQPPWYHKTGVDFYYNGGITIVGIFTAFNVLCIVFSVISKTPTGFEYLLVIPILAINYYFLERGNRYKEVFEEYKEKFEMSANKKLIVAMAVVYALLTLVLTAIIIIWRHGMNHHGG